MKEKLLQKITSKEQFERLITSASAVALGAPAWQFTSGLLPTRHSSNANHWWLAREYLRMEHDVYEVTPVLSKLNNTLAAQHCVHISRNDRSRVALTMSRRDGEEDRQTIMSFGKYLRKFFLALTDDEIAHLEGQHRAYTSAELLFARTADEIYKVYTTMVGDTGCMRYPMGGSEFRGCGVHPTAAYEAPGIAVAYVQSEGRILARSIVWDNPDDAEDKRFVRMYGDFTLLQALLKREGYVMRDLAGAKLKAIPAEIEDHFVVPYLDGIGGDQSKRDGTYAALTGDGYMKLLTVAQANNLNTRRDGRTDLNYAVPAKSAGGLLRLKQMPNMTFVSALSQQTFNRLDSKPELAYVEGKIGIVARSEVADWVRLNAMVPDSLTGDNTVGEDEDDESSICSVYAPAGTPSFYHRYTATLDREEERKRLGYRKLDAAIYPEQDGLWYADCVITKSGTVIKQGDAVYVLPESGEGYYVHAVEVPALRKQGHINSYSKEHKTIIHKKRASLRYTESGSVFDCEHNSDSFVFLTLEADECWISRRSAVCRNVFGVTVWTHRGASVTMTSVPILERTIKQSSRYADLLDNLDSDQLYFNRRLSRVLSTLEYTPAEPWEVSVISGTPTAVKSYYHPTSVEALEQVTLLLEAGTEKANIYRAMLNVLKEAQAMREVKLEEQRLRQEEALAAIVPSAELAEPVVLQAHATDLVRTATVPNFNQPYAGGSTNLAGTTIVTVSGTVSGTYSTNAI